MGARSASCNDSADGYTRASFDYSFERHRRELGDMVIIPPTAEQILKKLFEKGYGE